MQWACPDIECKNMFSSFKKRLSVKKRKTKCKLENDLPEDVYVSK